MSAIDHCDRGLYSLALTKRQHSNSACENIDLIDVSNIIDLSFDVLAEIGLINAGRLLSGIDIIFQPSVVDINTNIMVIY